MHVVGVRCVETQPHKPMRVPTLPFRLSQMTMQGFQGASMLLEFPGHADAVDENATMIDYIGERTMRGGRFLRRGGG